RRPGARRCSGSGGGTPQVDAALDGIAVNVGELILGEIEVVEGGDVLLELGHAAGADQHGSDSRVAQGPGDGHLSERLASPQGDVVEGPDAGEVVVAEHGTGECAVQRGSGAWGDAVEVSVGEQALGQDGEG